MSTRQIKCVILFALLFFTVSFKSSKDQSYSWQIEFLIPVEIIDIVMKSDSLSNEDYDKAITRELTKLEKRSSDDNLAKLAVLYDYYLGEAYSQIRDDIVLVKGERMTHFLYLKMITENDCKKRYGDNIRCVRDDKWRKEDIQERIDHINEGLIIDEINCHKYINVIEYDKEMLLVAIKRYKKDKGTYPDNLHRLKGYIDKNYKTGLRIHDPCWSLYNYNVEGDKIIISSIYEEKSKEK